MTVSSCDVLGQHEKYNNLMSTKNGHVIWVLCEFDLKFDKGHFNVS